MRVFFRYILALLPLLLAACDAYDDFTTDPSARLTFSLQEVAFDTVITAEGSSTRTLMVRNYNDAGLRIRSVALEMGAESPFRVNVDGQYLDGGTGADFEVRTQDSIFVRLECTLPDMDRDDVTHYDDRLLFCLESGAVQEVALSAIGMDVYRWTDRTLSEDEVVDSKRPILVGGQLTVDEGVTMTVKGGTRLFFRDNGSLLVRGTLKVEGEEGNPVVMRGDRTDYLLKDIPYDNTPDRWNGVTFESTSAGNTLTWLNLHSARWGIRAEKTDLTLESCIFHNIAGKDEAVNNGLYLKECELTAHNTCISNVMGHGLWLIGGKAALDHCTMAQYLIIGGGTKGKALHLANRTDEGECPIEDYTFTRCLVMGYGDDVIDADFVNPTSREEKLLFDECYLNTVEDPADARFVSCLYDSKEAEKRGNKGKSPAERGLYKVFDTQLFLYDFTPADGSPCAGYGAEF